MLKGKRYMTKLILATDSFPYKPEDEISFILPELKRLSRHFDVLLLSHADQTQYEKGAYTRLPENVKYLYLGSPVLSVADKLKALLLYCLDRDGRREIREICAERRNRRQRFYQSLAFYAQTLSDQRKLRRSKILNADGAVIYYSYWYTYYCYSAVREARRSPNLRVVTRAHGVDLYHERAPGNRQPFRHQMEAGLQAILFACHYARRYYEAYTRQNIDRTSLYVCRVGTEDVRPHPEWGARDTAELVSCSNMVPLKRISLIIDGLALIDERKIHWLHIGDGSERERLQAYAEEKLGQKDNISYTFSGYMDNDKVTQYYADNPVDCFITTSSTEGGSPVSVQEAMAQGIPVIGTDVGGITEMIQGNGVLLPADPSGGDVAAAIERVLSFDGKESGDVRNRSRELWKREFCVDVAFDGLLQILNGLPGKTRR